MQCRIELSPLVYLNTSTIELSPLVYLHTMYNKVIKSSRRLNETNVLQTTTIDKHCIKSG
jgi:hypothetical protein